MQRPLDFYADGGALLRETVPFESLPDFVKVASYVGGTDLDPSGYAVILVGAQGTQPVFPRIDPGNTAISTYYLLNQADDLPEEVVKVAAANLAVACKSFGMDIPPELMKLADLGGDPGLLQDRIPYVDITGLKNHKEAEKRRPLPTKPAKVKADKKTQVGPEDTKLKTAKATTAPIGNEVGYKPAAGQKITAAKAPSPTWPHNPAVGKKLASVSYDHTQSAANHFNTSWKKIHPLDRVKLAQKLVPDARALGIELVPEAYAYASGVMDAGRVKVALQTRQVLSSGNPIYSDLQKIASDCSSTEMIEAIWQADEDTGLSRFWNSKIDDPFLSVMQAAPNKISGKIKTAEAAEDTRFAVGGSIVTDSDLKNLAERRRDLVCTQFGEDFGKEFCKHPVQVFKSMPDSTKEVLGRMARDQIGALKDQT